MAKDDQMIGTLRLPAGDGKGLTDPNPERMRVLIASTPPGMAHWCGTGPARRSCRECVHYEFKGYYATTSMARGGRLKPGRCRQYRTMMGNWGPAFKWHVAACMFFAENPKPPPGSGKP